MPTNAEAELLAALSFGFLASGFVTEPETWPVFMEWIRSKGQPSPELWQPEHGLKMADVLCRLMRLEEALSG